MISKHFIFCFIFIILLCHLFHLLILYFLQLWMGIYIFGFVSRYSLRNVRSLSTLSLNSLIFNLSSSSNSSALKLLFLHLYNFYFLFSNFFINFFIVFFYFTFQQIRNSLNLCKSHVIRCCFLFLHCNLYFSPLDIILISYLFLSKKT